MYQQLITFNAGELSPYLRHRLDFDKTPAGAEELRNFIAMPYGGIIKRPGLLHLTTTEAAPLNSAAFPFVASTGDRYILHFTADTLTIYGTDGTVKDTLAFMDGYEWPATFDFHTSIRAIQLVQLNDVAFIAHPGTFPLRLSRTDDTTWTLEAIPFTSAPTLDENTDRDITMSIVSDPPATAWATSTVYAVGDYVLYGSTEWECLTAHTGSGTYTPGVTGAETHWTRRVYPAGHDITATLTGATFISEIPAGNPGLHYRVTIQRDISNTRTAIKALVANNMTISTPIVTDGAWNFTTHGTWHGTFTIFRYNTINGATDFSDAEALASFSATGDANFTYAGTEDDAVALAIRFEKNSTTGTTGDQGAYLSPETTGVTSDILLTAIDPGDSTIATGTTLSPCISGFTYRHAQGAFSPLTGYPRAIAFHDARLWFAGTSANPVSIWASKADDYLNFTTGSDSSDAIFATLALSSASPIRWMASQRRLFVGTALGEWVIGSESTESPVSPANFMARQYSSYGSLGIQPLIANDTVFFAERNGSRLRAIAYDASRESYDAADLSRIAEHLTSPGVSTFAWQQTREPCLWTVRQDGTLLHFAYARAENVAAWSRHDTEGGYFRDVIVFPSDSGDDDVFFIIDRDGAGCLERFPADWQRAIEDESGTFHLDGIRGTGTSATIPAHLLGTPVTKVIAGVATTATIATSPLAISPSAAYQIGFPVESRLIGLPIDLSSQDGTTLSRRKRIVRFALSLYASAGGYVWNLSETRKQPIPANDITTGWLDIIPDAGHQDEIRLAITHSDHRPFCLRAAAIRWFLTEG
jgi:hypothetical protein